MQAFNIYLLASKSHKNLIKGSKRAKLIKSSKASFDPDQIDQDVKDQKHDDEVDAGDRTKVLHPWLLPRKYIESIRDGERGAYIGLDGSNLWYRYMRVDDQFVRMLGPYIVEVNPGLGDTVDLTWKNRRLVEACLRDCLSDFIDIDGLVSEKYVLTRVVNAVRAHIEPWVGINVDVLALYYSEQIQDELATAIATRSGSRIDVRKRQIVSLLRTRFGHSRNAASAAVERYVPDGTFVEQEIENDSELIVWALLVYSILLFSFFPRAHFGYYCLPFAFWQICDVFQALRHPFQNTDLRLSDNTLIGLFVFYASTLAYTIGRCDWTEESFVSDFVRYFPTSIVALVVFVSQGYRLYVAWYGKPNLDRIMINHIREIMNGKIDVSYKLASLIGIQRTCSKNRDVPQLHPNAMLTRPLSWDEDCETKIVTSYGTCIPNVPCSVPMCCRHDQYNGLRIRFLFDRQRDPEVLNRWLDSACTWFATFKGQWRRYTDEEWLSHLAAPRARMLKNSLPSNLQSSHEVDLFVKKELYVGKSSQEMKPRIIQGRQLSYQMAVGSYFYSVSKYLASCFQFPATQWIYDNGLDALQLGDFASRMFAGYKYVYEIDVSNWDGSLDRVMLRFEKFILRHMPEQYSDLKDLLHKWSTVSGSGKQGLRYSCKWGRRSGDMWTSSFNTAINLAICQFIFGSDSLFVAKGDDNFGGTNSQISVEEIIAIYASLGMTAKVKRISHIKELGYCSGRFYSTSDGWKWGVAPLRILCKFGLNLNNHPPNVHERLLLGTAISMLPIAGHVPLVGDLLRAIVRSSGDVKPISERQYEGKTSSVTVHEVSDESIDDFCSVHAIDRDSYNCLSWDLSMLELGDFPVVLDHPIWNRLFCQEAGCEPSSSFKFKLKTKVASVALENIEPVQQEFSRAFFILSVFIAPPIEEVAKYGIWYLVNLLSSCDLLIGHLIFGCFEGYQKSQHVALWWHPILHVSFCLLPRFFKFPHWYSVFVHSCWNLLVCSLCWYVSLQGTATIFIANKNTKKMTGKSAKNKNHNTTHKKKSSLGRSLLTGVGSAAGSLFGPLGTRIGESGANWLSDVLGMGDYEVKNNSLMNNNSGVPNFSGSTKAVRIKHREYLGDLVSSEGFQLYKSYVINPGDSTTFPWLSRVATSFQSYKLKGCLFEFNTMSADAIASVNTALGSVIMSTQYNSAAPDFLNKAEMEQYEFSCSTKPSKSLIHPVECSPPEMVMDHLYVRTGIATVYDPQFYDLGKFQIATQGMQEAGVNIGEIWVTYDVELYKQRIAPGGAWPGQSFQIENALPTNDNPFGPIQSVSFGELPITLGGSGGYDTIIFGDALVAGTYLINIRWIGGSGFHYDDTVTSNLTVVNVLSPSVDSTADVSGASIDVAYSINGYQFGGSTFQIVVEWDVSNPTSVAIVVVAAPLAAVY